MLPDKLHVITVEMLTANIEEGNRILLEIGRKQKQLANDEVAIRAQIDLLGNLIKAAHTSQEQVAEKQAQAIAEEMEKQAEAAFNTPAPEVVPVEDKMAEAMKLKSGRKKKKA